MEPLAHALVRGLVFEVVIAKGDVKLRHLARNPPCVLVVFGAVQPFRGVEVRGEAELVEGDVTSARVAIAGRNLDVEDGERFAGLAEVEGSSSVMVAVSRWLPSYLALDPWRRWPRAWPTGSRLARPRPVSG